MVNLKLKKLIIFLRFLFSISYFNTVLTQLLIVFNSNFERITQSSYLIGVNILQCHYYVLQSEIVIPAWYWYTIQEHGRFNFEVSYGYEKIKT